MEEKGSEIRDCNFERDTGFGDFTKRDLGNVILKSRDSGSPLTKMVENVRNQPVIFMNVGNWRLICDPYSDLVCFREPWS